MLIPFAIVPEGKRSGKGEGNTMGCKIIGNKTLSYLPDYLVEFPLKCSWYRTVCKLVYFGPFATIYLTV